MVSAWRIIFFGTPSFALPSLEALLQGPDDVVAVVTQPDRRKGRGLRIAPSPVKERAAMQGLPVFQPASVKEASFHQQMRDFRPDLFIVVAFGQILPKMFLDIPKHGAINVHGSLLPKYRGAAPIAWAILKGERVSGVTTMMMDEGMDTGDILLQSEVALGEKETFETLRDRLARRGAQLLVETVEGMKAGVLHPTPQDHSKATYAPSFKKDAGLIEWGKEAQEIDRMVRAFNPWPGAFTRWEGRILKVYEGEIREGHGEASEGTVVWVGSDFIEVATRRGVYRIRELQLEGGKKLRAKEFLSGHPIPVGTALK